VASVLAATVRVAPDLGTAEECVQDAVRVRRCVIWGERGITGQSGRVVDDERRAIRALDVRRRSLTAERALPDLCPSDVVTSVDDGDAAIRRRSSAAGLHVLSPGALDGCARRAHSAWWAG
jgi:hypothetical protein